MSEPRTAAGPATGEALMAHVRALAEGIGPRPATSAAEAMAHAYAAECLQEWGARVAVEPFRSHRSFSPMWLLTAALLLAGGALTWAPGPGWPAAACGVLGALLFWGIASGSLEVGRLFPQGESRNVVGRISPRGQVRRRVVLVAHADSTRAALLWHPSQVRTFGAGFRLNTVAAAWLALAALGHALAPGALPWQWLALPGLVPVGWGFLILLHREAACRWVQGANDNASGVAVVLGLAERFLRAPLVNTEVWAVISGCEEVGAPVGAMRFLRRHAADLGDAAVLVVDNVGAGAPVYATGEGSLRLHRAGPDLVTRAARLAAAHPEWGAGPTRVVCGAYTDAHPFQAAGYSCLAILAERGGVIPNWHWPTDVVTNVEPAALARAFDLTAHLVLDLDSGSY